MTPQIGDAAPDFEPGTTEVALGTQAHNGSAPKHLLEVMGQPRVRRWCALGCSHGQASTRKSPRERVPHGVPDAGWRCRMTALRSLVALIAGTLFGLGKTGTLPGTRS